MENLKAQIEFLHEIEVKEILDEAREQAEKTVKEAVEKAREIKAQKMKELSEKLRIREESELVKSELEGRKKILNVKFQLFEEALAKAVEKTENIINKKEPVYNESVKRLVIEASIKLDETELEILVNSRDKKFVEENLIALENEILALKGETIRLQISNESLDTLGGAIVRTKDKRKMFNNTLETRLAKVKQEMIGQVYAVLFEGAKD